MPFAMCPSRFVEMRVGSSGGAPSIAALSHQRSEVFRRSGFSLYSFMAPSRTAGHYGMYFSEASEMSSGGLKRFFIAYMGLVLS